jgi:sugar O-acyltransferase (sialic acid O-acetyltransferase NeuD family)
VKPILLIGGGGHCRSCIDVIEAEGKYKIAGIVNQPGGNREPVLGYEVLGNDEDLPELLKKHPSALITVGQIKSADLRVKLFCSLKKIGAQLPIIISPHAYVSGHAALREGTIVMHGAIINAGSSIGENCIINTQALIEHDTEVKSHSHISTGAKVNGGVSVGKESFVGCGSVIHESVQIGEKCIISAGSVVRNNIPAGNTFGCIS